MQQRNYLHLQGQRIGEQVKHRWRFMVENHHHGWTALEKMLIRRCAAAGSHAGKSAGKPTSYSWKRERKREKDGMYRKCWTHSKFQGSFLTCALVPRKTQTLWIPVVPYVELIPVLEPVLSDSTENSWHSPAIANNFLKVWDYWHPDVVPISWKELKYHLFPERRVPELNIPLTHRAPVEKQLWRFGWRQKSEATQ